GHAVLSVYGKELGSAPAAMRMLFTLASLIGLPAFMFVAGRLARPERGWRWLLGRVWRLLVPYAAWATLQWFVWYRPRGAAFFASAALNPSNTNALWFLYALFVMSALLVICRGNNIAVAVLAVACIVLPWPDDRRFAFSYVAMWLPVVAAGYLTRRMALRPGPVWAVVLAISAAALWAGPGANLLGGSAPEWIGSIATADFPGAYVIASAILRAARSVLAVSAVLTVVWLVRSTEPRALRWLGTVSLGIYCAHIFFVSYHPPQAAIWVFASALGSLLASAAVVWLLQRSTLTSFLFLGSGLPLRKRTVA
ncbi:MAG: acyltransferase family protein, partial [Coriobacteriia bacterium]